MTKLRDPEVGPKRVRAFLGGELVVDTKTPLLVWENPNYPQYYFPIADIRAELVPTETTSHSPSRGDAKHFTIKTAHHSAVDGGVAVPDVAHRGAARPRPHRLGRDGRVVRGGRRGVHPPAQPVPRVDILDSSRHVRVIVEGVIVAESEQAQAAVRDRPADALLPPEGRRAHGPARARPRRSRTARTRAPRATGPCRRATSSSTDIAWSYPTPLPESQKIAGLVAFYNEKVDHEIDGEPVERPHTAFS